MPSHGIRHTLLHAIRHGIDRGITTPTDPRFFGMLGQSNDVGRADVNTSDEGLDMASTFANALIAQKTSDATTNPVTFDFDYAARSLQPYRAGGQPPGPRPSPRLTSPSTAAFRSQSTLNFPLLVRGFLIEPEAIGG